MAENRTAGWSLGATSLRGRIVLAFVALLLGFMASQAWLLNQQRALIGDLERVSQGYLPLASQVARLREDQERVGRQLARLNEEGAPEELVDSDLTEIYNRELARDLELAKLLLKGLSTPELPSQEVALLSQLNNYITLIERHFATYEETFERYLRVSDQAQQARVRGELIAIGDALFDDMEQLEGTLTRRIRTLTTDAEERQTRSWLLSLGFMGVWAAGAALIIVAVLYALRPMGRLTAQVQRLAAGEYGERLDEKGAQEVAVLAAEFNKMSVAIAQRDMRLQERAEELKRLSGYLSNVLDSMQDALVVVDRQRVSLANPAAADRWGVRVERPLPERLREALASPEGLLEGRGDTLHSVRRVPFGQTGEVLVVTDVTRQIEDQQTLARSERLALVGQMLAQITHEVRNPLNALSLNAELLGDEIDRWDPSHDSEGWDILRIIVSEIERLTSVTGHYLQLARRPPVRVVPVDLELSLSEVDRLLRPELASQGVTLGFSVEPGLKVWADEGQWRQALLNIVRNAVEAGAKHIRATAAEEGEKCRIIIDDDGPGMSPEQRERALDPFYSTKSSGTGLGLAITRQIMDDHGGGIELQSRPSGGTRVMMTLRRVGEEHHEQA